MKNIEKLITNYKKTTQNYEKNIILAEIISEIENTLKYFCMKYKNIPLDGEDLRAEMLQELYKSIDEYSIEVNCEFRTYLSSRLENKCNKLYRDLTRLKRVRKDEDGEIIHAVSYDGLLEEGIDVAEAEGSYNEYSEVEIRMFLDKLDLADEEKLICEGYIDGLKPSEIGKNLGISPAMITYKTKKIRYKMQLSLNFL